jgi:hypothetical protein
MKLAKPPCIHFGSHVDMGTYVLGGFAQDEALYGAPFGACWIKRALIHGRAHLGWHCLHKLADRRMIVARLQLDVLALGSEP